MRFRIITLLLFFALGKAFSQGNSIYQVAPMPMCWNTPDNRDSNLIAYWIFSQTQPVPKVVSYIVADGTQVVVSGGTLQHGFCCCNSSAQDTIGITINGDTLILVQNGETYTYIGGGGGDDDWRWVDPGADKTMYEAVYRLGKVSIFTTDTTHALRLDSTYQFRTDGGTSFFEWLRGTEGFVDYKTLMFRAPGGATGAPQNDANNITIARTNTTTTRTNLGSIKFAAPYTGGGGAYRVGAQISALDELGGNDTTGVILDFWTRKQGESFMRNTMTLEGDGRLELDRYNLFSDGVPANFLGYDVTDKDVKRHPISGTAQPNYVPGINALGTGMEWKDPSTFGPTAVNIYNNNGSIPAATNRLVTVPTDSDLDFTRGDYNLGYYTTGLSSGGTAQGWASKFSTSATNFSEVFAGTQITPRAGMRTIVGTTRNYMEVTNNGATIESRNTSTNSAGAISASPGLATMSQITSGTTARQLAVGNGFIYAWDTNSANTVNYPSLRPGANSFWRYNNDGTGQYVAESSVGATDLTFSGASSPVTLNSSTGADVVFTAGLNTTFSQTGNNLTITAAGDGNGIYSGSGTVPASTAAALLGSFSMQSPGGIGLSINPATGILRFGDVGAPDYFQADVASSIYSFGTSTTGSNTILRIFNSAGQQFNIQPPDALSGGWTWRPPEDAGSNGEILVNEGGGVTDWKFQTVYLTMTHTSFQEVPITSTGIDAIVIPPDLDGYTIVQASYRAGSLVADFDLQVEIVRTTTAGTVNTGFLPATVAEGTRYLSSTTTPLTVVEGDLIQSLVTGPFPSAEGLSVTLKLTK